VCHILGLLEKNGNKQLLTMIATFLQLFDISVDIYVPTSGPLLVMRWSLAVQQFEFGSL
jgi:hypothetical protein